MKKTSIITFICFILTFPVFSQEQGISDLPAAKEAFKPEWAFGFNGGVSLSKISFNPIVNQDYLQQYVGGFTVRYISEKTVGLQVELNYSMRGWKEQTDTVSMPLSGVNQVDTIYTNYSRSLSYLELPIMTHICFGMGKRAKIFFLLGPQLGYYLNEKVLDSEVYGRYPEGVPSYYQMKVQRVFDYGLLGGMGFELRTGIGSFLIDGRYYFGLSDIFSNHQSDYFHSSSNQVISLKASYLFRK